MIRRHGSSRGQAWLLVWLVGGLLGLTGDAARAADPTARFSVLGQFGGGLYSMGRVNDGISKGNSFLLRQGWSTLGEIRSGFNFSYDLRARVRGPLTLSLGGGRVLAQSGIDFDQVISVKPRGSYVHLRGIYQLPFRPLSSVILSVGAGPVYFSSSQIEVRHEHRQVEGGVQRVETATFKGKKGLGAHGFLQAEMVLSPKVTLVADVGYRRASMSAETWKNSDWKITEVKNPTLQDLNPVDGISDIYEFTPDSFLSKSYLTVQLGPDGKPVSDSEGRAVYNPTHPVEIDFSGILANVGLRFYLF